MKLAFLIRHFDPQAGGAERYAYEVVHALRLQHECHVFCMSHIPLTQVRFHVFAHTERRMKWWSLLRFAYWTQRQTQAQFDAVFSNENVGHGEVQMVHVRPIRHALFHESCPARIAAYIKILISPRLAVQLALEAWRLRAKPNRYLVAPSEMTASQLIKDLGHDPASVRVVLPGVTMPAPLPSSNWIQQTFGLQPENRILLMVAHDLEKKGFPLVIQALKALPKEVHLVVTPDRRRLAHWVQHVHQAGLQSRVHWLKPATPIEPVYACAHILVHPTKADVYGMVLLEAMAHGLPVICTTPPFCGAAWHWRTQEHAWLLNSPDDLQGLIQGITHLLRDPHLREKLKTTGQYLASQQTWPRVAHAIESLLIEAASA